MSDTAQPRLNPYPPYVRGEEARRRWRMATAAALISYGFSVGDDLDRSDRMLLWQAQRSLYRSDIETGPGDLPDAHRAWLTRLGMI
jgi:hypothetical protein